MRLVGYGSTRPTLVLPANTPGFRKGLGVMAIFTSIRHGQRVPGGVASPPQGTVPSNDQIPDANQTTFYSGMSNIDVEIGAGNPAAVAVRFHVAQHGTDDTDALRKAIASHPVLYFPTGYYIVTDTIALRPDTAIIALHPGTTQLDLSDSTPAFAGAGPPKALLETPQGGTNVVSGLGLYTGGINPRAVAALWMSGESSLMYDVRFHGPFVFFPQQVRDTHYKVAQPSAPGASGRWGAQYPSLWVTRGGGGTFASVWSPNTFARSGF